MGENSFDPEDNSPSQPSQAAPLEAAEVSHCTICLGHIKKPAYAAYCMHCFCFKCIRQWVSRRDNCPVCRRPVQSLLHTVRGDGTYEEYLVGLPVRLRRRMALEMGRNRPVQHHYNLRRRPATNQASAGTAQRQGTAPAPPSAPIYQAPDNHAPYNLRPRPINLPC